jgi:hypothetical protein
MMRLAMFAAAAVLSLAGQAAAEVNITVSAPGYSYFNRPGATLKIHDAELMDCLVVADRAQTFDRIVASDFSSLTRFLTWNNVAVNTENCMIVKGWRVVIVSDTEGKRLMKLSAREVAQTFLADRVGEASPRQMVFRKWNNDAGSPEVIRGAMRPNYDGKPSLSVKGLDPYLVRHTVLGARPTANPLIPPGSLRINDATGKTLARLPADSALIVVDMKNISTRNGWGMTFERVGADPKIPAWIDDGLPWRLEVNQSVLKPEGRLFIAAVPPGTWRLEGLTIGQTLHFCLGAPSFELKPGEVVFAGSFDMSTGPLRPDMDLAVAKKALAARPDFADRVQPARYVNGSTGVCLYGLAYALEFPEAPFAERYVYGSAAEDVSVP